jgi:S-adenosylmethionine:tRNA ribosyltransferase-isomerase
MRTDEFEFNLPEELIALRPAVPRDAARLLVVRENGALEHHIVRDLPQLLGAGDIVVVNDSKVVPARLYGRRLARSQGDAGAKIEVLLHKRLSQSRFRAFVRPAKRLKRGDRIALGDSLKGEVVTRDEAEIEIILDEAGADINAALEAEGEMPLPPYIAGRRKADARDLTDYQTVYAEQPGSVAAPTAGLHFTPELLSRLAEAGVARAHVTLHVGAGTFLPVSAEDTEDHRMHGERAELSAEGATQLNRARELGGRIVAVGSTALRTIESASDHAGHIQPYRGETALFITPGYRFKAVNVLLTNFHLPRSTLFMLVSAFSGSAAIKAAYQEAIARRYRFYSYGDACLLFGTAGNR